MSDKEEIRRRFSALLGERKLAQKIAAATSSTRSSVFRWLDDGFPEHAVTILEFMELTPRDFWPERITIALSDEELLGITR